MALNISVPRSAAKPLPGAAAIRSSPGTQTQTPTLRFLQLWAKTIFSLAQPPAQCPSSRAVEDTAFNPLRTPSTSSSPSVLSLLSFFSPLSDRPICHEIIPVSFSRLSLLLKFDCRRIRAKGACFNTHYLVRLADSLRDLSILCSSSLS